MGNRERPTKEAPITAHRSDNTVIWLNADGYYQKWEFSCWPSNIDPSK